MPRLRGCVDFFAARTYRPAEVTALPRFLLAAWMLVCLAWGCASCSSASDAPAGTWPTAPPEAQGFDSGELASVIEKIDSEELPFDSVQIVRDGVLVLDA